MRAKLSIITLGVRDLAASRRFYADGLGWPLQAAGDDEQTRILFLELENVRLALYGREHFPAEAPVAFAPPEGGTPTVTLAQNFPSPAAVDAAMAEAEAAGATVVKRPEQVFWGGYSGYFADPDGYLWELAYNPFDEERESS